MLDNPNLSWDLNKQTKTYPHLADKVRSCKVSGRGKDINGTSMSEPTSLHSSADLNDCDVNKRAL